MNKLSFERNFRLAPTVQFRMIDTDQFYYTYHGHPVLDLVKIWNELGHNNEAERKRIVWLAGDSSVDNKYWILGERVQPVNGYDKLLEYSVPDVAYHLNNEISKHGLDWLCINCAVEESRIIDRKAKLLPQDKVIQELLRPDDVLIISLGGNDIALKPTCQTVWSLLRAVVWNNNIDSIRKGTAPGLQHLKNLFSKKIEDVLNQITSKVKPKLILVCMIYNPDKNNKQQSWANFPLRILGYDSKPEKVIALIDAAFEIATSTIQIEGIRVVPVALNKVLDGNDTSLYIQRVEPSSAGGRQMAKLLIKTILAS
jgi:lysophospholipase L1-like esterase